MRQVAPGENGRGRLWLLLLWTALIVLVVVPWETFQNHSHWARVQWLPFVTPPIKLSDIVANLLLYMPFGYLSMRVRRRPRVWQGVALAFVLSATTELTQVYSHGRFPSTTDIVNNVAGAWVGAALAMRSQGAAARTPKMPPPPAGAST
jgi:glycopeptide antibiotics resistance protein